MGQSRRDPTPEELRRRAAVYRSQAESPAAGQSLKDSLRSLAARLECQAQSFEVS